MPLEIGQLVINARVIPDNDVSNASNSASASSNRNQQQELVEKCVAEVLRVLEDRMER